MFINSVCYGLTVVYRIPHHLESNSISMKTFLRHIQDASDLGYSSFIFGDFNWPDIDWDSLEPSPQAISKATKKSFIKASIESGLSQLVQSPTRGKNILDLIFASCRQIAYDIKISDPLCDFSDHRSLQLCTSINLAKTSNPSSFLDYSRTDWGQLESMLWEISWPSVFSSCISASQMWEIFRSICTDLIKICVPKGRTSSGRKCVPWSKNLQKLKSWEHRLKIKHKQKPSINTYMDRCRVSRLILRQRADVATKMEQKLVSHPSSAVFWKFVRGKLNTRKSLPVIHDTKGDLLISDAQKADGLAKHFASFFKPDENFPLNNIQVKSGDLAMPPPISLRLVNFEERLVLNALKSLPSKRSTGPDGIPTLFLKKLRCTLAEPLSSIFHTSISTGEVPSDWRSAIIAPVPKSGPSTSITNYRPISLTSTSCKLMEKMIRDRLLDHCITNNLLNGVQFGSLPHKSVETQLLRCLNDWTIEYDNSRPVAVLYTDISKAYDTISHSKLLKKLENFGVTGFLLSWIKAFLSDRSQSVKINKTISDPTPVLSGIPQGSVLGPLLFLLYVNDFPSVLKHAKVVMYVDDFKLYMTIRNAADIKKFQADIDRANQWFADNNFDLSIPKCVLLFISKRKNVATPVFTILGEPIPIAETVRDLGVLVDKNLSFNQHIRNCITKANAKSAIIKRAFFCRSVDFKLKMFRAYVRPHLETAMSVWSPHSKELAKLIENVQRSFTASLPGQGELPYQERLSKNNLKPLVFRRVVNDLVLIYKWKNRMLPGLTNLPLLLPHPYRAKGNEAGKLRIHHLAFSKPQVLTAQRQNFWTCRTVSLWNQLDVGTVSQASVASFKSKLNKNLDESHKINKHIFDIFPNVFA